VPRSPAVSFGCVVVFALFGCIACGTHYQMTPRERFSYNVSEYLELRNQALRAAGGGLKTTDDPAWLDSHVDQLAQEIQRSRKGLRQGVFFSPSVAMLVRTDIVRRLSVPDGHTLTAAILEVQPRDLRPRVNDRYPEDQPRPSTPPSLLQVLPPLPPVLEYRFVGRDLLLIDRMTGVILDVLPSAIPS